MSQLEARLAATVRSLEAVTQEKRRVTTALAEATAAHKEQVHLRHRAEEEREVMRRQRDELVAVMRQLQESAEEQERIMAALHKQNAELAADLAHVRTQPLTCPHTCPHTWLPCRVYTHLCALTRP